MSLYRPTNNQNRRRLIAITLLVCALFSIDIVTHNSIRRATQLITGDISGAGRRAFYTITHSGLFQTRASLAAENEALKAQVAQYQSQSDAYKALTEQNVELSRMINLAQEHTGTTTPVISSFMSSPYGTFLIGAGSADGITINALVLTNDGFVVGTVSQVSSHTALVSQLLAPGKTLEVLVGSTPAKVDGLGGGNGRAQIPRDIAIEEGNMVTSASAKGLPIGIVGKVDLKQADAYSTVLMRLPQNLSSLRYLYVVPNEQ